MPSKMRSAGHTSRIRPAASPTITPAFSASPELYALKYRSFSAAFVDASLSLLSCPCQALTKLVSERAYVEFIWPIVISHNVDYGRLDRRVAVSRHDCGLKPFRSLRFGASDQPRADQNPVSTEHQGRCESPAIRYAARCNKERVRRGLRLESRRLRARGLSSIGFHCDRRPRPLGRRLRPRRRPRLPSRAPSTAPGRSAASLPAL